MTINFKPQKVLHLKDELAKKNPKLQGEFIITEKFEGWYVTIYFDGTNFHNPLSSAMREIPSLTWVADKLNTSGFNSRKPLGTSRPFTIIAEAYREDTPFEILNGLLNRSKDNYQFHEAVLKVHDVIFTYPEVAINRLELRSQLLEALNVPFLHKVQTLAIEQYNKDNWSKYFDTIAEAGGEGIVAKRVTSIYLPGKRNSDLIKLKLECTVEALADRLEEGIGAKGNPSLTLVSKRKNGTEIRTVISKHSDQTLFREVPSTVLGKVVQLKAMEEYEDGQLRQPVFQHIRNDKLPTEID